jgi:hypothetical protein
MRLASLAFAAIFAFAAPALANEYEAQLKELATSQLAGWGQDPFLHAAIVAQNAANAGLTEDDIIALDKTWRAEVGASDAPLINRVLSSPASEQLRKNKDAAAGLITEVFVMDNRGLNVAQSDVTSDYWQGDEDKWQASFGAGAGAIHIGEVELDESTQTYQSQISIAISDDAGVIGAITFGINLEAL